MHSLFPKTKYNLIKKLEAQIQELERKVKDQGKWTSIQPVSIGKFDYGMKVKSPASFAISKDIPIPDSAQEILILTFFRTGGEPPYRVPYLHLDRS